LAKEIGIPASSRRTIPSAGRTAIIGSIAVRVWKETNRIVRVRSPGVFKDQNGRPIRASPFADLGFPNFEQPRSRNGWLALEEEEEEEERKGT